MRAHRRLEPPRFRATAHRRFPDADRTRSSPHVRLCPGAHGRRRGERRVPRRRPLRHCAVVEEERKSSNGSSSATTPSSRCASVSCRGAATARKSARLPRKNLLVALASGRWSLMFVFPLIPCRNPSPSRSRRFRSASPSSCVRSGSRRLRRRNRSRPPKRRCRKRSRSRQELAKEQLARDPRPWLSRPKAEPPSPPVRGRQGHPRLPREVLESGEGLGAGAPRRDARSDQRRAGEARRVAARRATS